MPFDVITTDASGAIDTLSAAIAANKGADPLTPTTVVVPTNVSGVMARRALGREHGVIGVDMVTLNRLAELLAGPTLAAHRRQPVSNPVLDLTVKQVLDEAPGTYAAVAAHPSTIEALRELHQELRLAGSECADRLAETRRGRDAVRVSRAMTRLLRSRWYDEADLLTVATELVGDPVPVALRNVVVYLPSRQDGLSIRFLRRLAEVSTVRVVVALTGDDHADLGHHRTLAELGIDAGASPAHEPAVLDNRPRRIVSTTDADDEVNVAVRCVIDAARGATVGHRVPFERIAVLWPTHRPYARLVEHHLSAADIPWNGRGGTELTERLAPRLLLDLLDVDRRGLRRRALFDLLADIPTRDADGRLRRTAEWERVSRAAGVSGDDDWAPRLAALRRNERWTDAATSLGEFVSELRALLGHPQARRPWRAWVDWCVEQLDGWLGTGAIAHFSDSEYRAWESLMAALERLRCLDVVSEPVRRSEFRSVLDAELSSGAVREGRIGTGVTVGSLASAAGLDLDVAIVLGGAEGLLPPGPRTDPLLSDADRERAGLARSDERSRQLHHEFVALAQATHLTVTMPRGDLRATRLHQPSRWLPGDATATIDVDVVPSASGGLAGVEFPPSRRERRLRDLLRAREAGTPLPSADDELTRRLAMYSARHSDTISAYDGDLSTTDVPTLSAGAVSPTQIEAWASCPHAYFVRYLLGVRPVDDPDAEISINALDRGLVQHDTLDRFHHDVIDGTLDQPTTSGWSEHHLDALLAHFDAVCEQYDNSGRIGRPATWAGERIRMRDDLVRWLQLDGELARTRGVTILDSEHRFPPAPPVADTEREPRNDHGGDTAAEPDAAPVTLPLPDGRHLAVRGSIDRLDRCADGNLVVTDHKTGSDRNYKRLSSDDPTLDGTVFQLPTYAAAALARFTATSDGAAGGRVRSEYSMFAKGGYKRIGFDLTDDVWARVRHDLGEVVDGIEAGWFPQVPERPGFRLWIPCMYCEPDGLGTAESWAHWQRKRHDERIARWFAPPTDDARRDDDTSDDRDAALRERAASDDHDAAKADSDG